MDDDVVALVAVGEHVREAGASASARPRVPVPCPEDVACRCAEVEFRELRVDGVAGQTHGVP